MRLLYDQPVASDAVLELAEKLVQLMASSGLTYRDVSRALEIAQDKLCSNTKPSMA